MKFVRFMSTPTGRGIRVVAGLGLVAAGAALHSPAGWGLAAFGLLPLVTGAADICPVCAVVSDEDRRGAAGCSGSSCS